ncbi:NUDIX domain-containing protein [Streptococcus equi]|uniref:NUDIX domain-containing protein n=1 Tax=Streptococcus equi TaxID=1336 RepID=UPI0020355ED1|nr:NUDIX domain-containing protein [Streptococcus equi]
MSNFWGAVHSSFKPGEVSFPSGRVEEGETYQQAAIRETVEELNIEPEQVHVWGRLTI